jgi:hypothetical protein
MAGRWVDEEKGNLSEESWSIPIGDSMVGTWRMVVSGKAKIFELLTMVEASGTVVLRLRHFDAKGVGWEEKDAPLVLPLVEKGPGLAVFEQSGSKGLLRLAYRREGDVLSATLTKGSEPPQEYRFRRATGP